MRCEKIKQLHIIWFPAVSGIILYYGAIVFYYYPGIYFFADICVHILARIYFKGPQS